MVETVLTLIKRILPEPVANLARKVWHPLLSFFFAYSSGLPAKHMTVIGVNGTKGKSTTAEMVFAIVRHAGNKTALASTIRFAIDDDSTPNKFKMTMPGRGFIQRFLKRARRSGATHAVVELTTEGAREWRHKFLFLDALIMLNVQREHIERFGSFENYVAAKWTIAKELERSPKKHRAIIVSLDDEKNAAFKDARVPTAITFSKNDLSNITSTDRETSFTFKGVPFTIPLPGSFNATNAVAAILAAEHIGIPLETSREALAHMPQVRGRLEPVDEGQSFEVVVDYAHTPDSLTALYGAFPHKKVCVLGNTGGGRDTWKRPLMGQIAALACETVILTNEDPYDEDPQKIVDEMAAGMEKKPLIIMDRRDAIKKAIEEAARISAGGEKAAVLISGKGTDPYIMEANGKKTPWSDSEVAREILREHLGKS